METFGVTLIDTISSSSVTFLNSFISSYWGTILTIGGVLFIGRWFLRLTGLAR